MWSMKRWWTLWGGNLARGDVVTIHPSHQGRGSPSPLEGVRWVSIRASMYEMSRSGDQQPGRWHLRASVFPPISHHRGPWDEGTSRRRPDGHCVRYLPPKAGSPPSLHTLIARYRVGWGPLDDRGNGRGWYRFGRASGAWRILGGADVSTSPQSESSNRGRG